MRVIILTSRAKGVASLCLPGLAASEKIDLAAAVLVQGGKLPSTVQAHKKKIQKIMQIGLLGTLNGIRMRSWYKADQGEHLEALCKRYQVPFYTTQVLNSDETYDIFQQAQADLGLSLGNSYIARRIFSAPSLGMVNLHKERLPAYQNAQSIIWPIYNLEITTGLTLHQIDDHIDTGKILFQREIPIAFRPSLRETVEDTGRISSSLVPEAVRYVCENYDELSKQAQEQGQGRSYTTPSFWQFLRMVRNNKKLYARSAPPLEKP